MRTDAIESLEAELGADFRDYVTKLECADMVEERAVSIAKSMEMKRAA